jgi:hypothetical protein
MASIPILPVKSFLEFLKFSPSWFKVQNFSDLSWEPPSTFEKGISNHKKFIGPPLWYHILVLNGRHNQWNERRLMNRHLLFS